MKVFFSGSFKGAEKFGKYYKIIYDEIERQGYSHLDNEIVKTSYEIFTERMSAGREEYVKHYRNKMDAIQKADICIFEVSNHSLGIGFLAQRALDNSKPTIALYYEGNIPYFLSGVEDDKLIVESYNENNLKKVIKKILSDAREKRDKRFNFFLSPKLLDYLDKAAKVEGVTKSKLLRDMILRHMRENNEAVVE